MLCANVTKRDVLLLLRCAIHRHEEHSASATARCSCSAGQRPTLLSGPIAIAAIMTAAVPRVGDCSWEQAVDEARRLERR